MPNNTVYRWVKDARTLPTGCAVAARILTAAAAWWVTGSVYHLVAGYLGGMALAVAVMWLAGWVKVEQWADE